MTIPLTEPLPSQYMVRATSDRWLGSMTVLPLTFQHLILPESHPPHTGITYIAIDQIIAKWQVYAIN